MTQSVSALQILRTRSVPDLVREEILHLIKTGELTSGNKLNELTFAQHFQVSRAPIREAFRALEEAGLVRLEKNRGVFVREIAAQEALELYELRGTLDETAGRLLAPVITDVALEELGEWLTRLEATAAAGDMAQYFPLNIGFHDRIVEMTGNTTLLEFYRRLIDRMHLLRRRNFTVSYGSEASRTEHRAIVEALATRNPCRAAAVMRAHVSKGYQRLLSVLKSEPVD